MAGESANQFWRQVDVEHQPLLGKKTQIFRLNSSGQSKTVLPVLQSRSNRIIFSLKSLINISYLDSHSSSDVGL